MNMLIINITAVLLRLLFRLRYRLVVKGLDELRGRGGCLIMPNHPAEVDPVLVSSQLWKLCKVRPVVVEKFYYLPVVHFILSTIRSIPIPEMERTDGAHKRKCIQQSVRAVQDCIAALRRGENLMVYPSGRLMRTNVEQVGEKSGVHTLLKSAPNAAVVLVRTSGLYGSIFSRALSGRESPDFWDTLKKALAIVFKNFVFFVPKRTVTIEFEPAPPDFPYGADAAALGSWLSNWYNRPGPDGPTFVAYSCWTKEIPELSSI
jgi:long-chain-fatty-acid--[acyl-carrier-protein] ligase